MKEKKQRGIIVFALTTFLALNIVTAKAEQASNSTVVYAGLEPVMTLECIPINFGVYQVARGDRGIGSEPTISSLSESESPSDGSIQTLISFTNDGTDQIALSDKIEHGPPQAGSCTVKSSRVQKGTLYITRDPVKFTELAFSSGDANPFASELSAPKIQANSIVSYLTVADEVTTSLDGNATFNITGQVRIPNNLVADNYGSYQGAELKITVSDSP